jgi:hypothetical protein
MNDSGFPSNDDGRPGRRKERAELRRSRRVEKTIKLLEEQGPGRVGEVGAAGREAVRIVLGEPQCADRDTFGKCDLGRLGSGVGGRGLGDGAGGSYDIRHGRDEEGDRTGTPH